MQIDRLKKVLAYRIAFCDISGIVDEVYEEKPELIGLFHLFSVQRNSFSDYLRLGLACFFSE